MVAALAYAVGVLYPASAYAGEVSITAQVPVQSIVQAADGTSVTSDEPVAGTDKTLADIEFAYTLTPVTEGAPVPTADTVTLAANEKGAFEVPFTQNQLGVWEYRLKQKATSDQDWAFDDTEYTVHVQVFWYDDAFDRLFATVVFYDNATGEKCDPAFEYTMPAPEPVKPAADADSAHPKTGDSSMGLVVAIAGIAVAALVLAIIAFAIRKKRAYAEGSEER